MSKKLSIQDLPLEGKKALIRVDFNVPIENGQITDTTRIRASLPSIRYALEKGAAIILLSHLGRPEGKKELSMSLFPTKEALEKLLGKNILWASDCIGDEARSIASQLAPGQILLLENLRFHAGEEHPEQEPFFAGALAELGDVYINDAFACSHREHSSISQLPTFFPGKAAAGFLLEKEIDYLGSTLKNPARPFCAILGGSKISTKFKVIESLMQQADLLLIGGGMAFNFLKAENVAIGSSLYEPDFLGVAREILDVSTQSKCRILLPVDLVIAQTLTANAPTKVVSLQEGIPEGWKGVDIGPATVKLYKEELKNAATIFWNGPMGIFEIPSFDQGTKGIAEALSSSSATTIVGGGDSVAAVEKWKLGEKMSHLSTGGGASLEYIQFGTLPGIESLSDGKPG